MVVVAEPACPLLRAGRSEESDGSEGDVDEHLRILCGLCVSSAVGTHHHPSGAHGLGAVTAVKPVCPGSVCPACGTDFWLSFRVVVRMRQHTGVASGSGAGGFCRQAVLSGAFPRMDGDQMAAADEADRVHRKACRAAGISCLAADGFACRSPAEAAAECLG